MLENVTLVTPFGKEDTAAELQSHTARTPWRTPKSPKSSHKRVQRDLPTRNRVTRVQNSPATRVVVR